MQSLGGFEVYHKLELGRLLNGQVRRVLAFEDAACVLTDQVVAPCQFGSITHQSARIHIFAPRIHYRHCMACRERDDLVASSSEERVGSNKECAHLLGGQFENRVDLALGVRLEKTKLIA